MFGYLRPMKPELKISEYRAYNAVYCGFCRALGKSGAVLRLTLSYDFTFFSLLSLSLCEEFCGFDKCRCPVKPFGKRACVKHSPQLSYAADLAVMMLYAKLKDNLADRDGASLFSRLFLFYIAPRYRKAAKRLPSEKEALEAYLLSQAEAEAQKAGVDACCDPTARLLSQFFKNLSKDQAQTEHLERLGYVLGRWIYLLDAADDLKKDLKSGAFNPLKFSEELSPEQIGKIKEETELSLNICISEACDALLNLKLYHFEPIIKNIIFLGLKNTQSAVLHYESKKERKLALNGKSL